MFDPPGHNSSPVPRPDQRYSGGSAAANAARDLFNFDEHAELDAETLAICESIARAGMPDGSINIGRSTPRHRQRGRARRAARRPRKSSPKSDDGEPDARKRARGRWQTAYHEAGHAVAFWEMTGRSPLSIEILDSGPSAGCCITPDADTPAEIVLLFGGPIAHARYAHVSLTRVLLGGGVGDAQKAQARIEGLLVGIHPRRAREVDAADYARVWSLYERETRKVIALHWSLIQRVASELHERGKLDADDFARIAEGAS